ncbi:RNA-binding protein [Corvid orthoreovirus]|nr:RNA-binding protein [Corvid orthoreovirus]
MEGSVRVGVSRNTANAAQQQILRNFYLLRCTISADARQATKAVQAYFPFLQRVVKMLSPLAALTAERTLRPTPVRQMMSRETRTLADCANSVHHPSDLPSCMTASGLDAARFLVDNILDGGNLDHVLPAGATTYSPAVVANLIARVMAGFVPVNGDDFRVDGQIDLLAAELVAFKFVLPFFLELDDQSVRMCVPHATVEEMLHDRTLLNFIDASFGIESKSDQRMTRDSAEMSSRSLNELPNHDRRGRMPWKFMLVFLAVQLKHELDMLIEQRTELQANSHVTTFGGKLFQQMSVFVPIDKELLQLALSIKEMGFAMNPSQVLAKWRDIRNGVCSVSLDNTRVDVRFGAWTLKRGDDVLLTVQPAKMA